jgi:hypothetical protein
MVCVIESLECKTVVLRGELIIKNLNNKSDQRYIVPAVDQAVRVLFSLAETGTSRKSLTEICAQVGIHKSKAFSILHTLQKFNLVQRNGKKKGYPLGPGLITLAREVIDNFNIPGLSKYILENLATKVKGTAALGIIEGRRRIGAGFEWKPHRLYCDHRTFFRRSHKAVRAIGG